VIGSAAAHAGASAIYAGELTHARWWPVKHAFRYPVYMLALDLDELPALEGRLRLFSYNRRNVVALHDRDYLDAGAGLAASIRRFLADEGAPPATRIVAVTHARVFGYAFNPVSFFYCLDAQGRRTAVVAEVNNTFGDTHRYLLDARNAGGPDTHFVDKLLHVSPFMDMRCGYAFHFHGVPDEARIEVAMDVSRRAPSGRRAPFFAARMTLARRPLTDGQIAAALARWPLMTVQVTARIHLQALRLWIKGAPFRHQPPYDPDATRRMHADDRTAHDDRARAVQHRQDRPDPVPPAARGVAPRPPDPAAV
jgi:uncharacterized protein